MLLSVFLSIIRDSYCEGGHGLSIGSLGENGAVANVQNVLSAPSLLSRFEANLISTIDLTMWLWSVGSWHNGQNVSLLIELLAEQHIVRSEVQKLDWR